MTFSIVARCAETGQFGLAISSSSPAVAARCAFARAGVGAVATQNVTNPALGPAVLDRLEAGARAKDAVIGAIADEAFPDYRQVIAVDGSGGSFVHSGRNALGIWTATTGRDCAAGGNLLAMLLVLLCAAVVFVAGLTSAFLNWVQLTLSRLPMPAIMGWSPSDANFWLFIHSWFVVPGATTLIFGLLYIILPSRQVPVKYAIPGAVFSGMAWKLSSIVYLEYVVAFGSQNPLYGSVWGIVGLLVWLYIEASVFLLGAELVYVTLERKGVKKKR